MEESLKLGSRPLGMGGVADPKKRPSPVN